MKLLINEQEIPLDKTVFYTWFHLIDWLLKNKIDKRQGIVELLVDGKSYRHVLSSLNSEPFPASAQLIEIHTQDAYAISQSGLQKVQHLITALHAELPDLVETFRQGDLAKGSGSLSRFIQSLIPIIEFIKSISQNFDIDFSTHKIDQEMTIQALLSRLQDFFHSLNSAQERSDSVELADLMEFEMSPLLDQWRKATDKLYEILPQIPLRTPPA